MYKKGNIKILLVILVLLAAVFALIKIQESKQGERTFRSHIVDADTSNVTAIVIKQPKKNKKLELYQSNGQWKVKQGTEEYAAYPSTLNRLLSTLDGLKTESVAAMSKDSWNDYEVTDSVATKVIVKTNNNETQEFLIGKFNFKQPKNQQPMHYLRGSNRGTMQTYIRLAGENEVYIVEGYLKMIFRTNVDNYRDKTIIRSNKDAWTRLSYKYPGDSSFVLEKVNKKWMINGSTLADSNKVISYLNRIDHTVSNNFINVQQPKNYPIKLEIEGEDMTKSIEIKAVKADTINNYFIRSTMNPNALFADKQNTIFKKVFIGKNKLLPDKTKSEE
jgi:hypothetical protein